MSTPVTLAAVVEDAGDAIRNGLLTDAEPALLERIDAWRERHGLDRLDAPVAVVGRQAAFAILLKATLYELRREESGLPSLSSSPRADFAAAREETGDPAFEESVLDEAAWSVWGADRRTDAPAELAALLQARHRLGEVERPAETIGRLYETVTPQESRRKLGQFRTPRHVADLMATWLVDDGGERVLDPGVGAGALSAAAHRQKRAQSDGARISAVEGVDLDPLAIAMGATALRLLDGDGPHALRVADFLELSPADVGGPVDAVIANPPYTRHHELDEAYKADVNARIEDAVGRDVSALSPTYAYFYYHAAAFLEDGGRLSFVTPSEFLETGYGESLQRFLLDEFDVRALVLFDRDGDSQFDEALTTSLVSFLEKSGGPASDEPARFVRVEGTPDRRDLLDAVEGDVEDEPEWGTVTAVPQGELTAGENWTNYFDPLDVDTSGLTPLGELASVTRGVATGQNDYFCLTQGELEEWGIDERYLSKLVRDSRSVPGYEFTEADWERQRNAGEEVWLLYHVAELEGGETAAAEPASGVRAYLEHGASEGVGADRGYLAEHRDPWYEVDRRESPPILVTYMSRGGSRFVRNEVDALYLTNLHGIYPEVDFDEPELDALLAYCNSDFASDVIRRSGRTYSTGMDKIEPNELESVPVLDPRRVDDATVEELARLFDDLRDAARDGGDDAVASVREAIDAVLDDELQP